jgi:glycine cleavage system H protein
MDPKNLRFTRDHEWVAADGTTAVVGITDHAQHALGDITFVELPKVGKRLKAHDVLGVVESVKAASDIFAPVAGVVKEANAALNATPELINQEPYGKGWICKLEGVDMSQAQGLMTAEQYEVHCKQGQ